MAVAAGARGAEAAERPLTETEVTVKTPDGNCDAAFIHPTTGTYPGVLIWPDAFGLRPAMRQFARRIAADGYSVLVPNPFYRTAKAPVFDNPASFNFENPDDRAKLPPLTGPLQAAGAAEKDAVAYVAFLDAQKDVDRAKKIGTQGYCMGGSLVVRTAAAAPNCLARHAARRVSCPGRAISYRLKPSLVRSAFDSCRTGPIEGLQRLWANCCHVRCTKTRLLLFNQHIFNPPHWDGRVEAMGADPADAASALMQ